MSIHLQRVQIRLVSHSGLYRQPLPYYCISQFYFIDVPPLLPYKTSSTFFQAVVVGRPHDLICNAIVLTTVRC